MEIADMGFWRGEAYAAYVDYLESTGGFYYEVGPVDPSVFRATPNRFLPSVFPL